MNKDEEKQTAPVLNENSIDGFLPVVRPEIMGISPKQIQFPRSEPLNFNSEVVKKSLPERMIQVNGEWGQTIVNIEVAISDEKLQFLHDLSSDPHFQKFAQRIENGCFLLSNTDSHRSTTHEELPEHQQKVARDNVVLNSDGRIFYDFHGSDETMFARFELQVESDRTQVFRLVAIGTPFDDGKPASDTSDTRTYRSVIEHAKENIQSLEQSTVDRLKTQLKKQIQYEVVRSTDKMILKSIYQEFKDLEFVTYDRQRLGYDQIEIMIRQQKPMGIFELVQSISEARNRITQIVDERQKAEAQNFTEANFVQETFQKYFDPTDIYNTQSLYGTDESNEKKRIILQQAQTEAKRVFGSFIGDAYRKVRELEEISKNLKAQLQPTIRKKIREVVLRKIEDRLANGENESNKGKKKRILTIQESLQHKSLVDAITPSLESLQFALPKNQVIALTQQIEHAVQSEIEYYIVPLFEEIKGSGESIPKVLATPLPPEYQVIQLLISKYIGDDKKEGSWLSRIGRGVKTIMSPRSNKEKKKKNGEDQEDQ